MAAKKGGIMFAISVRTRKGLLDAIEEKALSNKESKNDYILRACREFIRKYELEKGEITDEQIRDL